MRCFILILTAMLLLQTTATARLPHGRRIMQRHTKPQVAKPCVEERFSEHLFESAHLKQFINHCIAENGIDPARVYTIQGYDHRKACDDAFTEKHLDWIFSKRKTTNDKKENN